MPMYALLPIFHVLLVTANSDQDPDPHGTALVWLSQSGPALWQKALIRIRTETSADPNTSALSAYSLRTVFF
jgi:hypothetical protein